MAEYLGPNQLGTQFSPVLQQGTNDQKLIMDTFKNRESIDESDPMIRSMSHDVARATAYGAQSGGISGALTSGGIMSMLGPSGMSGFGPYAAAGGLILSQIEAHQKALAAQEQERIENEKKRRANMLAQYNTMAGMRFDV